MNLNIKIGLGHLKVISSTLINIGSGLLLTLFSINNIYVLITNVIFIIISYIISVKIEDLLLT